MRAKKTWRRARLPSKKQIVATSSRGAHLPGGAEDELGRLELLSRGINITRRPRRERCLRSVSLLALDALRASGRATAR
eukprot:CAMPEP_0195609568 /NCGR_PEP_ID=MMETSP0815-20121206/9353_1 /TAXON_ID=97485 /ORGANISM="Prymnesium parvum, Strain Texoma1" /LENGTH=78 /DNA_ID=CAMNT_0040749515 /DNA_START=257 /DNA_END=490 /DNA_ORIENTATION=+